MKTEKLNSWLTLFANIGVVIGLVLLIIEIRQNTEMMKAQMSQSRSETARAGLQATYNSDHMPSIVLKVQANNELTEDEVFRYRRYIRSIHRNQDNILWQYNQGLLHENTPRIVRDSIRRNIGQGTLSLEIWDQTKNGYSDEYITFVEEAIADLR